MQPARGKAGIERPSGTADSALSQPPYVHMTLSLTLTSVYSFLLRLSPTGIFFSALHLPVGQLQRFNAKALFKPIASKWL